MKSITQRQLNGMVIDKLLTDGSTPAAHAPVDPNLAEELREPSSVGKHNCDLREGWVGWAEPVGNHSLVIVKLFGNISDLLLYFGNAGLRKNFVPPQRRLVATKMLLMLFLCAS